MVHFSRNGSYGIYCSSFKAGCHKNRDDANSNQQCTGYQNFLFRYFNQPKIHRSGRMGQSGGGIGLVAGLPEQPYNSAISSLSFKGNPNIHAFSILT